MIQNRHRAPNARCSPTSDAMWSFVAVHCFCAPMRTPLRPAASLPVRAPVSSLRMMAPDPGQKPEAPLLPRALLLAAAVGYGSNFPIGRLMLEAVPPSVATSGRFALAALVLSPFLPRLDRSLVRPALLCGAADCLGYVAQSMALVDTPAAKVAFLGALTVIWVPALDGILSGRDLRPRAAPQVWLAACLTLLGLAFLELGPDPAAVLGTGLHAGDAWAAAQAIGFGSSFWIIERMMAAPADAEQSSSGSGEASGGGSYEVAVPAAEGGDGSGPVHTQALPIAAVNVAVIALLSAAWAVFDGLGVGPFASGPQAGWMLDPALRSQFSLPGLVTGPVGVAVLWTGLATTALTRVGETTALASVAATDAAVVVATEPVWAAAFGVMLCGESLRGTDILGGLLLVAACLASSLSKEGFDARLRSLIPPPPFDTPADRYASRAISRRRSRRHVVHRRPGHTGVNAGVNAGVHSGVNVGVNARSGNVKTVNRVRTGPSALGKRASPLGRRNAHRSAR